MRPQGNVDAAPSLDLFYADVLQAYDLVRRRQRGNLDSGCIATVRRCAAAVGLDESPQHLATATRKTCVDRSSDTVGGVVARLPTTRSGDWIDTSGVVDNGSVSAPPTVVGNVQQCPSPQLVLKAERQLPVVRTQSPAVAGRGVAQHRRRRVERAGGDGVGAFTLRLGLIEIAVDDV